MKTRFRHGLGEFLAFFCITHALRNAVPRSYKCDYGFLLVTACQKLVEVPTCRGMVDKLAFCFTIFAWPCRQNSLELLILVKERKFSLPSYARHFLILKTRGTMAEV